MVLNRTLREQVFNRANGDRFRFRNIAIVITDGQSNVNKSGTFPAAILLRNFTDVFVVGVTNQINMTELKV